MVSDSDSTSPSEEREAYSYACDGSDQAQSSHRSVNNKEVLSSSSSSSSEESSSSRSAGDKGTLVQRVQGGGARAEAVEAREGASEVEQSKGDISTVD